MKMSSTTIFDFYVGIVCTFKSSQIAASGELWHEHDLTLNQGKLAAGFTLLMSL